MKDPIQEHAEILVDNMKTPNVPNMVLLILYDLRFPINRAGFRYLKDIIPVAFQNPSNIVESELYDKVGGQYTPKVSRSNMDSAVGDVVQKAWDAGTYSMWRKYFPEYIAERETAPTNLEFISGIVFFLHFWLNCYEKEADYERI